MNTAFDQLMDLRDHYASKTGIQGTIRWFDGMSGEGMVTLSDGQSLYLHFSAIYGIDKNNYQYPVQSERKYLDTLGGVQVTVTPYITPGYIGCTLVVVNHMVEGL